MRLGVQFSGPRTVVSIGLDRGETESSAGFARWGWDWLAPDLSLYPIVSAYVVMGRARTPERQNASAPGLVKGRLEYQSGFWTTSVRCAGKWVFLRSRLFSLFARPSLLMGSLFSPSLRDTSTIHRFLACFTCWIMVTMDAYSDELEFRRIRQTFDTFYEDTFYDVTFMKVYIFINTELSTENITSTLLRVFYIFAHCKILRILVSLNFPLIRKNP